jgi:hypothetical protein
MSWTPEKDRHLLLTILAMNISVIKFDSAEAHKLGEIATPPAIRNRFYGVLRKEALQLLDG